MKRVRLINRGGLYFDHEDPALLPKLSSGCTLFDCVLGGGWALDRVINVVGDRSTGKTLLAIEACANFLQRYEKRRVVYIETEAAFDRAYAAALGIDLDDVDFGDARKPCETVEDLFIQLERLIKTARPGVPTLCVVDSLDALSDAKELTRGIDEASFGAAKAKQLSQLFRRVVRDLSRARITLFIISQVRDKIGVVWGKTQSRSGGRALDFYSSQIVWLSHLGQIAKVKHGVKRTVGVKIKAKCEKNKVGQPFRECEFPIYFAFGIEDVEASVEFLCKSRRQRAAVGQHATRERFLAQLRRLPDERYSAERERLAGLVRATWENIEAEFRPVRSKYGTLQ